MCAQNYISEKIICLAHFMPILNVSSDKNFQLFPAEATP